MDRSLEKPPEPLSLLPEGVRLVSEVRRSREGLGLRTHPGWSPAFPWLVHGVTERGEEREPADFGLFGGAPTEGVLGRWCALAAALEMPRLVHGRQVHGAAVRFHRAGPPGLEVAPATDGHATRSSGVLLTVSTADCVPIFVVDPGKRAVALLHGGWRGIAAGVFRRGLEVLRDRLASDVADLHLHLGPAICGRCYEVGPEVHRSLGLAEPAGPEPVDLRAVVAIRAVEEGVAPERITVSSWCTRCGDPPFFSHRGGSAERQLAFLGIAP